MVGGAVVASGVPYRHEAATGDAYAFVSEVAEGAGSCRATIPDDLAPWADRARGAPAFRGVVRLTRPAGAFAVTAPSRAVLDAFVAAAMDAMMACESTVERVLAFEVSTHALPAPGARARGRVLDRTVYRRGAAVRVAWSDPPVGEDAEADALNALSGPCGDPIGMCVVPYAPAGARALRECIEALAGVSGMAARFAARHRVTG